MAYTLLSVVSIIIVFLSEGKCSHDVLQQYARGNSSQKTTTNQRQLESFEWAKVFAGINSKTVPMSCQFQDKPLCCSALEDVAPESKEHGLPTTILSNLERRGPCVTKKEYFASPYETRHLLKAQEIAQVQNFNERHGLILDFITSAEEVSGAQKWLKRVKVHMSMKHDNSGGDANANGLDDEIHERKHVRWQRWHDQSKHEHGRRRRRASGGDMKSNPHHPDDEEYMSKFVVTTTCEGGHSSHWVEWIEPLSVHARHPFGEWVAEKGGREGGAHAWCKAYVLYDAGIVDMTLFIRLCLFITTLIYGREGEGGREGGG
jgi:hypothetical protein